MKERQFAAHINQKNSTELRREINRVIRELDAMKKRSAELSKPVSYTHLDVYKRQL